MMTNVRDQLLSPNRFPAEIIAEAVWLYFHSTRSAVATGAGAPEATARASTSRTQWRKCHGKYFLT
jgi:hypothetical protein